MGYRVAVVGATGNVGREMLQTLAEREFPGRRGGRRSPPSARSGSEVSFGEDDVLKVQRPRHLRLQGLSTSALFSPGRQGLGRACAARRRGRLRRDRQHLAVPHGPGRAAGGAGGQSRRRSRSYRKRNIIANPNCSTIQMVVALKPLHDLARIKRVVVATYQSVSGAGKEAMDELFNQTRAHLRATTRSSREQFTKQIAFNCIPHIDVFMDDGSTKEEWKMAVETRKILDPDIAVIATCVRVPVFIGHAEAVNVEFEQPISEAEARGALRDGAGRQRRRPSRRRGLRHAGRMRRRGCGLSSAACARTRRCRTACRFWVRRRQSAQGRGAQRGADRRASGEARAGDLKRAATRLPNVSSLASVLLKRERVAAAA